MRALALLLLVGACAHRAPVVPAAAPDPHADLCAMVFASLTASIGVEDDTHLDEQCVRDRAGAKGMAYAEAVGFDPMPVETITCKSDKWTVTIGQKPPQAPSDMILLVGFEDAHGQGRGFTSFMRYANWRKDLYRFPMHACGMGSVEGVVRREGGRWVVTMNPPRE